MWILVAEALGALGLLLFIVWWTLGPTQRRERDALRASARDVAGAEAAIQAEPEGRPRGEPDAAEGADAKPSQDARRPPPQR